MSGSACYSLIAVFLFGTPALSQPAPDGHDWRAGLAPGQTLEDGEAVVVHRQPLSSGGEFLPPQDLVARLVRDEGDGSEIAQPVGVFFQPPPGLYRFWIEGPGRISPFASRLPRVGELPTGMALVGTAPVATAGTVRIPGAAETSAEERFVSLLPIRRFSEGGTSRLALLRTVRVAKGPQDVQVPIGEVVGATWDRKTPGISRITRPLRVAAGSPVPLALESPSDKTQLVLRARRGPDPAREEAELDETMKLFVDGKEIPPRATASASDSFFAFWYDLAPGVADLEVEWRGRFLDRALDLPPTEVVTVDGDLRPRPNLTIDLALPSPLRAESLLLRIHSQRTDRLVHSEKIRPGTTRRILNRLPAIPLRAELVTPFGAVTRAVDLTAGGDGYVLLEPELTTVFGVVRRGGEPHRATVQFTTTRGAQRGTSTDEVGRYEVVAVEPLVAVKVNLVDVGQAPWMDYFTAPLAETTELDFDLPATDHRLRVFDRTTGEGIEGARLIYRNSYTPEPRPQGEREPAQAGRPARTVAQTITTDTEGVAHLPPLRVGSLQIRASADGFKVLRDPLEVQVPDLETSLSLEIGLDPISEGPVLRVLLPGGLPASEAEFQVLDSLQTGTALARGTLALDGTAVLPEGCTTGILVVRHPAAGSSARPWSAPAGSEASPVVLPPSSAIPLRVVPVRGAGADPEFRAEVAVASEAGWVSGGALRWLFGATRDGRGGVVLSSLPAGPVRLLAFSPERSQDARVGALDGVAATVPWPWQGSAEVPVVD